MRISEGNITTLEQDEIFVFGSNDSGIHGAGAAKTAYEKFGAKWGQAKGLQGQSYAIPTKNKKITRALPLRRIEKEVATFINFAKSNPQYKFLVTEIGCGYAGYTQDEIAPLFLEAQAVPNIYLPASFHARIATFTEL